MSIAETTSNDSYMMTSSAGDEVNNIMLNPSLTTSADRNPGIIQPLPDIRKILPKKRHQARNPVKKVRSPARTVQALLDSAHTAQVNQSSALEFATQGQQIAPKPLTAIEIQNIDESISSVAAITTSSLQYPTLTPMTSYVPVTSESLKLLNDQPTTSGLLSPKLLDNQTTQNLDALNMRPFSPRDINSSIEEQIISLVGESISHLGPNITSADLVAQVTSILKSLTSSNKEIEKSLQNYQPMDYSYHSSQESDQRLNVDAQWANHSQSSGVSQILDFNSQPMESNSKVDDMHLQYTIEGTSLLPVDQNVVIPLEMDNGQNHMSLKSPDLNPMSIPNIESEMEVMRDDQNQLRTAHSMVNQGDMLDQIMAAGDQTNKRQRRPSEPSCLRPAMIESYCLDCDATVVYNRCTEHAPDYLVVSDSSILTRARASLPSILLLKNSPSPSTNPLEIGVFAREKISKLTRFGPVFGKLEPAETKSVPDGQIIWEIVDSVKKVRRHVINCQDEQESNWLRFVQLARYKSEQNLVAYQENEKIYMVSRRDIDEGEELLTWYSAEYAKLIDFTPNPCSTWKCDQCNRRLSSRSQLKYHESFCHTHDGSKIFRWRCAYCPKEFPTLIRLRIHISSHLGPSAKVFACRWCSKTFKDASNLRQHLRTHTGEKPFPCHNCSATFSQKSHLITHQLVHTKERNLMCEHCDARFARPNELKLHIQTHTKEKVLQCPTCQREFYKKYNYNNHIKTHTKQKDYACGQCFKTFSRNFHLTRHLKTCQGRKEDNAQKTDG